MRLTRSTAICFLTTTNWHETNSETLSEVRQSLSGGARARRALRICRVCDRGSLVLLWLWQPRDNTVEPQGLEDDVRRRVSVTDPVHRELELPMSVALLD